MTVRVSGDKKLRVVVVTEGCEVPVLVRAGFVGGHRRVYETTCAVALPLARFARLKAKLESISLGTSETGGWLLPTAEFKKLKKVDGITPELWLKWNGKMEQESAEKVRKAYMSGVSNPFVVKLFNEASAWKVEEVSYFWALFQRIALTWLLQGKVLDLGFCKLGLLPYRPHWKELMARSHRNVPKACSNEREFIDSGLADRLLSRQLIAMDPEDKTASPNLECVPTDLWRKASKGAEKARLDKLGVVGYAGDVAKRIQSAREFARVALRTWCSRALLPFARVSKVGLTAGHRIFPDKKSPRSLSGNMEGVTNDIVISEPKILQAQPSLRELIDSKVSSVLQLPDAEH